MIDDSADATGLRRWSEQHALLMALAIPGALLDRSPLWVAAIAGGSFLGLIFKFRRRWTPAGRFGAANFITLARLLGVLAWLLWPELPGIWAAGLAVALLCADGLDGWVARRQGSASGFGHGFDQEVDALFFLALCVILYTQGRLGAWALLPGSLRYGYVLLSQLRPPSGNFQGNRYTRSMGVAAILAFTLCLLPVGPAGTWAALAATLGLCGSFGYSVWRQYRPGS
jgi:phosphatidylglycerophosphate synthase